MPQAPMASGAVDRTRQFAKTKLCKFELLGMCAKGPACPFAHGQVELRELPDLRCTKLCFSILQTGACNKPNCTFAHSREELRAAGAPRRTKLCRFAKTGTCTLGPKCSFSHAPAENKRQEAKGRDSMSGSGTPPTDGEQALEAVHSTSGAVASPSGLAADPEGSGLGIFSSCPGLSEWGWGAGICGSLDPWGGAGASPFGIPGPLEGAAFGGRPAYDEPAYVPVPSGVLELQGSVTIDQRNGVWQVKAVQDNGQQPPTLRPVRTSESTLCTLGDKQALHA